MRQAPLICFRLSWSCPLRMTRGKKVNERNNLRMAARAQAGCGVRALLHLAHQRNSVSSRYPIRPGKAASRMYNTAEQRLSVHATASNLRRSLGVPLSRQRHARRPAREDATTQESSVRMSMKRIESVDVSGFVTKHRGKGMRLCTHPSRALRP